MRSYRTLERRGGEGERNRTVSGCRNPEEEGKLFGTTRETITIFGLDEDLHPFHL